LLQSLKKPLSLFLKNQTEETSGYLVALFTLLIYLAGKLIGVQEYVEGFYYFAVIALIYGFIVFLHSLVKPIVQSGFGKIVLSGLFVIGSGVSLALARQTINDELQVPSSAYPITQSILTVLYAPLTLSICLALSGVIFIMLGSLLSFSPVRMNSMKSLLVSWWDEAFSTKETLVNLTRLLGLIAVVSLAMTFLKQNGWYMDQLASFTHWFAYSLESEQFSYCTLNFEERVAYLEGNRIVVASKSSQDEYLFLIKECM